MSNEAERLKVVEGQGQAGGSSGGQDPLVGQTIDGRYEVETVLGEGGMGLVYRARHVVLGKPLAVKVLRPDVSKDEEMITRFRQEAQSASAIGNEHIIDISDFGTLPDGSTYFVMEFLDGQDLTKAVENESPMEAVRTVRIAKQICRALAAAHERGIVHRDLKPDNIFLISRGDHGDFVKVLDFGIAKVGGNASKLTRAGQVFGTPHYMSPEQCAGRGVDQRTDVYALGIIMYEMVSGEVPFDADNMMGVLTKHLYEEPVAPSEREPPVPVPQGLEAVIMRCLAKTTEARYASMGEVLADLDAVEQGIAPPGASEPTGSISYSRQTLPAAEAPPRRRGLLYAGVAAVVVLAAAGGGVLAFGGSSEPEPEPEPAEPVATASAAEDEAEAEQEAAGTSEQEMMEGQAEATEEQGSAETAKVSVQSDPEGVEVWKGDELLGNTPVELPRPEGDERLEIELRKAGYESQGVRISPLTAESVTVTLQKEKEQQRARRRPRRRPRPRQPEPKQNEPKPAEKDDPGPTLPQTEVIDPWAQ